MRGGSPWVYPPRMSVSIRASGHREAFSPGLANLAVVAHFVANLYTVLQSIAKTDRLDAHKDLIAVIWGDEAESLRAENLTVPAAMSVSAVVKE